MDNIGRPAVWPSGSGDRRDEVAILPERLDLIIRVTGGCNRLDHDARAARSTTMHVIFQDAGRSAGLPG